MVKTTSLTPQTRQFLPDQKVERADQSQTAGRARVDALRTNPSLAPQDAINGMILK
jgi:hypothetical protein